jgi:N-acylglucosamine 2-epimerase
MLNYSWQHGWYKEYVGNPFFMDAKELPDQWYWHDMKLWWPQNETIIATLLAFLLAGNEKYGHKHRKIHDWAYKNAPGHEYGEWFGYLHRDGSRSSNLKSNLWKGPFQLPGASDLLGVTRS